MPSLYMKAAVAVLLLFFWKSFAEAGTEENARRRSLKEFAQSVYTNEGKAVIQEVVSGSNVLSDDIPEQKRNMEGCPVTCFRADPVCGVNGVTYWCGSKDAECNGVEVAHAGYCSLENGGATGRGTMAGQALLLIHMVWLIIAGILIFFGRP